MTHAKTSPVRREVDSRRGPLVVELTGAGLTIRIKGKRTLYGPISWDAIFDLGAKMHAGQVIEERANARRRVTRGRLKVGV